ncbi:MAG TPA: hypothetical protein VMV18_07085, partial [bacterium]|nr:hypothetical protein [bacterium]
MQGIVLFVDAARPGADSAQLARILGLDAYRARMLTAAAAPFVSQGHASLDSATRAVAALDPAGFTATAHDAAAIESVGAPLEAAGFVTEPSALVFTVENGGKRRVAPAEIRVLVQGKLTVKIAQETKISPARI